MEFGHAGGGQISEIARERIVHADAKGEHASRSPDRIRSGFQLVCRYAGERFFDISQRIARHVGIKPAQMARLADVLQPARAIRKVRRAPPDRVPERSAKILVPLKADLRGHAQNRVRLHIGGFGNLAHCGHAHIARIFQHVGGRLARFGRQLRQLARQTLQNRI